MGPFTATGDVGGGGGGGGLPSLEVGFAGVDFGVVRPGWIVRAIGGSKTPAMFVPQVDQRGSIVLTPGGIDNCGVQRFVRYWCCIESYTQPVMHLHFLRELSQAVLRK